MTRPGAADLQEETKAPGWYADRSNFLEQFLCLYI